MPKLSRLRFNVGHLLEANLGTTTTTALDYPTIQISDDLTLSPLQGEIHFTRTSDGIYISGELGSQVEAECVRCLMTFQQPITITLDEVFYHPPHLADNGEYTVNDTGNIDLGPLMREVAILALPMQPICKPNCQGLCMECGSNLNEGDCGCVDDDVDPRLAILGELLE